MATVISNLSTRPITALKVELDAAQWRAVMNGAAGGMKADLVTAAGTIPLPGLTFTASRTLPTGPVPGGGATRLSALATGLWVPPGATFELRLAFLPGNNAGPAPADVFINEFHYDNDSIDNGEFVEIAIAPGFAGNVSDISLLLYNGSNGAVYGTHSLVGFTQGATTASGHRLFHKSISDIQNGAPDGLAVVNTATSQVLQFISYEGSFTAAGGLAQGLVSASIGVNQTGTETIGLSALGLAGTGAGAADFSWTKFSNIPHSPGQPNQGQTFANPSLPPQGLGFDNLALTFLTDHDLDGDPDAVDPDDDNDGQSDTYENAFGSNSLNAASRFAPVIAGSPAGLELSFHAAQGITYTVQSSENLNLWQDLTTVAGTGANMVVPLPTAQPAMFFRVRAAGPAP